MTFAKLAVVFVAALASVLVVGLLARARRWGLAAVAGALALPLLWLASRAAWLLDEPRPFERALGPHTRLRVEVRSEPRPVVLHWLEVGLVEGVSFEVTPPEPDGRVVARRTSTFAAETDARVALNANFYAFPQSEWTPWHDFPSEGDPVDVLGLAYSSGRALAETPWEEHATLYLGPGPTVSALRPQVVHDAVSGRGWLVRAGRVVAQPWSEPYPRCALGFAADRLIALIVDGGLEGSREGMTLDEVAVAMVERGAEFAVELDGGGSVTLASPGRVWNVPTYRDVPGLERPVGVHLGIRD